MRLGWGGRKDVQRICDEINHAGQLGQDGQHVDLHVRRGAAKRIEHRWQVVDDVTAAGPEDRGDVDAHAPGGDCVGKRIRERRRLEFEECKLHARLRTSRRYGLTQRPQRLSPPCIARAVGKQDQAVCAWTGHHAIITAR